MTELQIGDRIRVTNHSELAGQEGTVVVSGPHQFEDEVTVLLDGDGSYNRYFRPVNIEKVGQDVAPSSFHFFETLLDAAEEAHPNSKRFYDELITCGLLHAQKQRDYGKPGDPFANVRSTEEWGISGWVGAMVRLNDKVKRLQSLVRTGGLANESAIDSFRDIAVYALIALVLYGEAGEAPLARGASA